MVDPGAPAATRQQGDGADYSSSPVNLVGLCQGLGVEGHAPSSIDIGGPASCCGVSLRTQPKCSPYCKGHRFDLLLRLIAGPIGHIGMSRMWRGPGDYVESLIED